MGLEHRERVIDGGLLLAQDPVAVLAHDRDPVHHHGLARAQQHPEPAAIELVGQIEMRVAHRRRMVAIGGAVVAAAAARRATCPPLPCR
jgi:hypothetical protein